MIVFYGIVFVREKKMAPLLYCCTRPNNILDLQNA